MRRKILQIGNFFIRIDATILDKFNILLGFNYCEGGYMACTDETREECMEFEYAEFQIGLLFFTIAFGKEEPLLYEQPD